MAKTKKGVMKYDKVINEVVKKKLPGWFTDKYAVELRSNRPADMWVSLVDAMRLYKDD